MKPCVHEGYAKHPCTQSVCTLGFAVRPIRPYGCTGRTERPRIHLLYLRGSYGEPHVYA